MAHSQPFNGGFSFGFVVDDDNMEAIETTRAELTQEETIPQADSDSKALPFRWLDNVAELLAERAQEEIVYSEIPLSSNRTQSDDPTDTDNVGNDDSDAILKCVDAKTSSFAVHPEKGDIVPGVYEGGATVWEGSLDLVRYLQSSQELWNKKSLRILELGCGHGLPACLLLRRYLLDAAAVLADFEVFFCDYNESVLTDVTLSNIVLNTAGRDTAEVARHVRFGAGDWKGLQNSDNPGDSQWDLILAAETLYTERAAHETAQLLARHLRQDCDDSVAYVASKRYYFGVGGGTDCFRAHAANLELDVQTVRVYDTGVGNIRELLSVRRRKG